MAEFKFQSTKKVLTIEGKDYEIDIGNKTQLKKWLSKFSAIDNKGRIENAENPEAMIEELEAMIREAIEATIGDWDRLWALSGENVFAMLGLIAVLSKELRAGIESSVKGYGL